MKDIENILREFGKQHGLQLLWKGVGAGVYSLGFPPDFLRHDNAFCKAIKSDPERFRLCARNDTEKLPCEALEHGGPFTGRCHAGVSEVVVPVFSLEEDCVEEMLMLGIFREAGTSCPYPELRALFEALPERRSEGILPMGSLLASLGRLFREYRHTYGRRALTRKIADHRIAKTLEYLNGHLKERLTVRTLAENVFLSESRFLHLFREHVGSSFSEYLMERRLDLAQNLLAQTDSPIGQVAEMCGFRTQSYFGAQFRKRFSLSPFTFRQRFGGTPDI